MTLPKDPEKREEYRRKLSKSKKEFYKDPEERRKLSESQKGKKLGPQTKEHRKNLSKSHIGKPGHPAWNTGKKLPPQTKEHRKNLSKSHIGQVAWNTGKKLPPQTKEHREKKSKFMNDMILRDVIVEHHIDGNRNNNHWTNKQFPRWSIHIKIHKIRRHLQNIYLPYVTTA